MLLDIDYERWIDIVITNFFLFFVERCEVTEINWDRYLTQLINPKTLFLLILACIRL